MLTLGGTPSGPASRSGDDSVVYLIDVARPTEIALVQPVPGALDGIVFYVLVVQAHPTTEMFHLEEARDLALESGSYSQRTLAEVGRPLEPQTIVEDIPDFFRSVRADLRRFEALAAGRDGMASAGRSPCVMAGAMSSSPSCFPSPSPRERQLPRDPEPPVAPQRPRD